MNKPKARVWRLHMSSQFLTSYKFHCKVSDRVAIVNTRGGWGIYGYPAAQGQCIRHGEEGAFLADKQAARKALDKLADEINAGVYPDLPEPKSE